MAQCLKCGAELHDYYCYACGAVAREPTVKESKGSAISASFFFDTIVGAITEAQSGATNITAKDWDIIFTDKRVIAARTGSSGKALFFGGFLAYAASKASQNQLRADLAALSPNQILKSHEDNFDMLYSSIKSVKLGSGVFLANITFTTDAKTIKFGFPKAQLQNAMALAYKYLHEKVIRK